MYQLNPIFSTDSGATSTVTLDGEPLLILRETPSPWFYGYSLDLRELEESGDRNTAIRESARVMLVNLNTRARHIVEGYADLSRDDMHDRREELHALGARAMKYQILRDST